MLRTRHGYENSWQSIKNELEVFALANVNQEIERDYVGISRRGR